MANVGSLGIAKYIETFAADNIADSATDGIAWVTSGDSGDTVFARAVNTARGLHATGATYATENNMIEFCGDQLMFFAQTGHSSVELLFMLDAITTVAFNFGLNDTVEEGSNSLPVELSGTTWTSNAGAFLGFVFDTDADNDDLHCFWVNGDVDTTTAIADLRMIGIAPIAAKWLYMKVEMQDRGSGSGARATFLCADSNGKTAEKTFDTTVARTTGLCFYLGIENRTGAVRNAYIKLPCWTQTVETN